MALFRTGRWSLLIGAAVLALGVIGSGYAAQRLGGGYLGQFLSEGAIILGWVARWRPIEIFLYEWWPLVLRIPVPSAMVRRDGVMALS